MKQTRVRRAARRTAAAVTILCLLLLFGGCSPKEESSSSSQSTPVTSTPVITPSEEDKLQTVTPDPDMLAKLTDMQAKNPDSKAWLFIPDTTIDNVVLQSMDNEYYLRRNDVGQQDFYGCYFADYECQMGERNLLSKNTVIYGHNMDDNRIHGRKFAQLFKFLKEDFAREHPCITLTTPEDGMTWVIFAAYYSDINFDYIMINPEEFAFGTILEEARARSEFIYDVDVSSEDKILTLSTCTYKYGMREDQRFVVQARLLRDGEEIPQEAVLEKNPSPKAPEF